MTDIVERLRFMQHSMSLATAPVCREAADEIERLRAQGDVLFASIKSNADEIERLTAALWHAREDLAHLVQQIDTALKRPPAGGSADGQN